MSVYLPVKKLKAHASAVYLLLFVNARLFRDAAFSRGLEDGGIFCFVLESVPAGVIKCVCSSVDVEVMIVRPHGNLLQSSLGIA